MIVKMNEISSKGLMEQTLIAIREQVPFVKEAKIETVIAKNNEFVTKIEVFLKKHKRVVAIKIDRSAKESIQLAFHAVLKQLKKIKSKNLRKGRRKLTFNDLSQVAGDYQV